MARKTENQELKQAIEHFRANLPGNLGTYATGAWQFGLGDIRREYGYHSARAAEEAIDRGEIYAIYWVDRWVSNTAWQHYRWLLREVGMELSPANTSGGGDSAHA